MRRFLQRLVSFLARGRAEDGLKREMEAHLALLAEDFEHKGLSPEEARLGARRAFGGVEQAKEEQRDARSFVWLEDVRRDVSYAARTLRRSPGFTLTAIVTLGLGIGSVTVIYSVLRNVLLEPFPYRDNERMVDVVVRDASDHILRGPLLPPEFLDYQEQSDVFEDVAAAAPGERHFVTENGAERLGVVDVTPNTFAFLGVRPLLGRAPDAADARPGAPPVAVLNHRTWITRFGGELSVLGRALFLDSQPVTIVGIMPPRFEWHVGDLWMVKELRRTDTQGGWFQAYLRPGVTTEQAAVQLNAIAARRAREFPDQYPPGSRVQVITIIDWVVGRFRGVLYTLFGAVGLLLLIACCNVANMLLARATTREREISVRAALGASRGRILRQLLMESVLLAAGGAALGCLLALAGIGALARILPRAGVAWEVALRLDLPVLAFALGAAAVATLTFGVFPALHAARRELMAGTSGGGSRGGTASRSQSRMRNGLVVAEVALSLILLFSAGLLSRTFLKLVGVELGFDPRNVLLAQVAFPPGPSPLPPNGLRFYRDALERLQRLPGVLAVGVANGVHPFGGWTTPFELPGRAPAQPPRGQVQLCSEGYAKALGLRLVSGRLLDASDIAEARKIAVVNETLAQKHLGGSAAALGRSVRLPRLASESAPVVDPTFEVVGVVRDVANVGVRDAPAPQAYVPYTLRPAAFTFVIRTSGDSASLLDAVRREIRAVDPLIAVLPPGTLESRLQAFVYAQPRFSLVILAMFSITGVLLVGLGVYGVMSYTVSQQTRQIAIRMALGGERRHVLGMVFRSGLRLLGAGVAAGLAASLATNRMLESQLWQLSTHDPASIAAAIGIVALVGVAACGVPAYRATRVPLVSALRGDD